MDRVAWLERLSWLSWILSLPPFLPLELESRDQEGSFQSVVGNTAERWFGGLSQDHDKREVLSLQAEIMEGGATMSKWEKLEETQKNIHPC